MSSINADDIRWNDEARAKILEDSDRVLREAVLAVASSHADGTWEDAFAELNARLKDQFIDFEPGPDLRKYAEAIVAGEIEGADGGSSAAGDSGADTTSDAPTDAADTGSAADAATDSADSGEDTGSAADASYGGQAAAEIAADAGLSEPATPETDGSAEAGSPSQSGTADSGSAEGSSDGSDPASGDNSDGGEAPNETIDDPSDPTRTGEPSA